MLTGFPVISRDMTGVRRPAQKVLISESIPETPQDDAGSPQTRSLLDAPFEETQLEDSSPVRETEPQLPTQTPYDIEALPVGAPNRPFADRQDHAHSRFLHSSVATPQPGNSRAPIACDVSEERARQTSFIDVRLKERHCSSANNEPKPKASPLFHYVGSEHLQLSGRGAQDGVRMSPEIIRPAPSHPSTPRPATSVREPSPGAQPIVSTMRLASDRRQSPVAQSGPAGNKPNPNSAFISSRTTGHRQTRARSTITGGRGTGFSSQELQGLVETIPEHLPLCNEEWETVARKHKERFPDSSRTVDSLKRKITALHRFRMSTGDPNMPEEVRMAKRARFQMTDRADIADAGNDLVNDVVNDCFQPDTDGNNFECTTEALMADHGVLHGRERGLEQPDVLPSGGQHNRRRMRTSDDDSISDRPYRCTSPNISSLQTPMELVQRRAMSRSSSGNGFPIQNVMQLYHLNMLADREKAMREERKRDEEREDERKLRDEDRKEEKERILDERQLRIQEIAEARAHREAGSRMHEQLLQVIMSALTKDSRDSSPR